MDKDIAFEYHLRRFVRDGGIVDLNAPLPDSPDMEIMQAINSNFRFGLKPFAQGYGYVRPDWLATSS